MPGKLVAFDEDTLNRLTQLGRNTMATFQELADEAFADLLSKHNVPIDLNDALKKSLKSVRAHRRSAGPSDDPGRVRRRPTTKRSARK